MTRSRAGARRAYPGRVDGSVHSSIYVREPQIDHGAWPLAKSIRWALLAGTISGAAHAEGPAPQSDRLNGTMVVYEAPGGCPSQSDFEARLRARSGGHGTGSAAPPPLRRVEARIQVSGKRAQGMVIITDAAGVATTRRIAAASCTEAVDALALIVALTLDPMVEGPSDGAPAAGKASGEGSPESGTARASESPNAGNAAAGAASAARPREEEQTKASETASEPSSSAEPAGEQDSASSSASGSAKGAGRFGAFVSAIVASGATPDPAFGGQAGLTALLLDGTPRLSIVAGARIVLSQSVSSASGTASFDWWAGLLAMCAGTHIGASSVSLDLCATFELGRLAASGSDTRNPSSTTESWQALGPALNAEWRVAPALGLAAGIEGLFPFRHQRFLIGQDVLHEIPTITFRAQVGVVAHF